MATFVHNLRAFVQWVRVIRSKNVTIYVKKKYKKLQICLPSGSNKVEYGTCEQESEEKFLYLNNMQNYT